MSTQNNRRKLPGRAGVFFIGLFSILSLNIIAGACSREASKEEVINDGEKRILFVGNSLTYTNDVPSMVKKLAGEKGIAVYTESITYPNYALEDHWNDGKMQERIEKGKFDFVVVQQGPSSQQDGREMLQDYGERIKELCDKYKTKLAFFVVWPAYANLHTFDNVIKNYTDAANATGSLVCPVGNAWKKYFSETNDYSYYGPDMFHPSVKGSTIAAEIITNTLFK